MSFLWLAKAPSQKRALCFCECTAAQAVNGPPQQFDCPWCGCGWLWTCGTCGKAFTYAVSTEVDGTAEDFVRMVTQRRGYSTADDAAMRAEARAIEQMGERCAKRGSDQLWVYLDTEPVRVGHAAKVGGDYGRIHHVGVVPLQATARGREQLKAPGYWRRDWA